MFNDAGKQKTRGLTRGFVSFFKWDMVDSNHRLLPCQGSALNQLS